MKSMHPGQIRLIPDTVKRVVSAQFPQWENLPLKVVDSDGTVNALFCLGDKIVLRFPLIPDSTSQFRAELEERINFLKCIQNQLPVKVHTPVEFGKPSDDYPGFWTAYEWIEGQVASPDSISDFNQFAFDLAEFVKAFHKIDTKSQSWNGRSRGGPLASADPAVRAALEQSRHLVDTAGLTQIWEHCLNRPVHEGPDVWIHADLMPNNLLVRDGKLVAVIDFEMTCIGDPAVDLMPAWNLLPVSAREIYRETLQISDDMWERGRAWALCQAIVALPYYVNTNPSMANGARRTIQELLNET